MLGKVKCCITAVLLGGLAGSAAAQSTIGVAFAQVIPAVAKTSTYSTEVFLLNAHPANPLTVRVEYVGGIGSASPGSRDCGTIVLPASGNISATQSFSLGTQCTLGAGSHFGMLVMSDHAAEGTGGFFAYSRTQNFAAIGFSIEGFTPSSLAAQSQRVLGLKRATTGTVFQSNCFIGSFDKPVDYRIRLFDSTGALIGSPVNGSLTASQVIRYLDIFGAAGLTGEYSSVTAVINSTNAQAPGNNDRPVFVSFCTVQDNTSFGADFRIGKSFSAWDVSYTTNYQGCTPTRGCISYDYAITDVTKKDVFALMVRPPDVIRCDIQSARPGDLEIQLRQPDAVDAPLSTYPPGSAAFSRAAGPVVAGGSNQTGFFHETGIDVMRVSDGAILRDFWSLEVSARELAPAPTVPIPYSIDCRSGNGVTYARPYKATDDF